MLLQGYLRKYCFINCSRFEEYSLIKFLLRYYSLLDFLPPGIIFAAFFIRKWACFSLAHPEMGTLGKVSSEYPLTHFKQYAINVRPLLFVKVKLRCIHTRKYKTLKFLKNDMRSFRSYSSHIYERSSKARDRNVNFLKFRFSHCWIPFS